MFRGTIIRDSKGLEAGCGAGECDASITLLLAEVVQTDVCSVDASLEVDVIGQRARFL